MAETAAHSASTRQGVTSPPPVLVAVVVLALTAAIAASLYVASKEKQAVAGVRTASASMLPRLVICSGPASYKPTTMYASCARAGSPDLALNLRWATWTPTSATAVGTLWTDACRPRCGAHLVAHRGARFSLSDPRWVAYCPDWGQATSARSLLFTRASLFGSAAMPFDPPPCPDIDLAS